MKNLKRVLFWIISLSWGFIMTFIGGITAFILIILGNRPKKFHCLIYFEIGQGWGGINLGAFFITSKDVDISTKKHEAGHALQNVILGIFMPFIIAIPSVIRYWYREYLLRVKKIQYSSLKPYDSIWFEGWATKLGEKYFK